METTAQHHHDHHHHHEMPTEGSALTAVAISATLHCLTGCALGEIAGMAIGTALGFSDWGTVALAVTLAFLFGYGLTSLPLLRSGLALGAVIPIALASDTLSIATMEIVDNAIMLIVPGAMDAGLDSILFWGALAFALVIAGVFAVPVNRYLIARGKGHAVVHETGIHGGPPVRLVAIAAAVAFLFGSTVLIAEWIADDGSGHGGHGTAATSHEAGGGHGTEHGGGGGHGETAEPVRGLSAGANGMLLRLGLPLPQRGKRSTLAFTIVDAEGEPVREFDVLHAKRMHAIVVRRDTTGFQHLHPVMDEAGRWSVPITLPAAGAYRVFADFSHRGEPTTLADGIVVPGSSRSRPLPPPAPLADAGDGYEVRLSGAPSAAGQESALAFSITRVGEPVEVERYLGAGGHLVALREGDLAFLHTHPTGDGVGGDQIRFLTEFPSPGRYRLFVQFKDGGTVRTAAFTRRVG
jgi:Domain of unknown function (DUF4396)